MCRLFAALALISLVGGAFPMSAVVRAAPAVRAGVPADAITPAGMVRVRIAAPSHAAGPVRMVFAERNQDRSARGSARGSALVPALVIDVWVAETAAGATRALEHWRAGLARAIEPRAQPGDRAYANAGIIGFARANVAVAIRRIRGERDLATEAERIARAIDAAPVGSPVATLVDASAIAVGAGAARGNDRQREIARPRLALAAELRVEKGPAAVRATAAGWVVTRTGPGPALLRLIAIDHNLRPLRAR